VSTHGPLTEQEVSEWKHHVRLDLRIAAEIADWARGKRPWHPMPSDADFEAFDGLDFVASSSTIRRAKRLLAERGMLVKSGINYYVAPSQQGVDNQKGVTGDKMSLSWHSGNAAEAGQDTRGWLLGHFIDPSQGVRSRNDVEVKWGIHPSGDKRRAWTTDDRRTTLVLLVHGTFRIDLTEGSVTLERQGDYAIWGPGIDHSWESLTDSIVLTIRWPSLPS
jgi:hypothetical protein